MLTRLAGIISVLIFGSVVFGQSKSDVVLASKMAARVSNWHADSKVENPTVLRLVYFHPSDREPQPKYQERLQRILFDIREFLTVEMRRLGLGENCQLPLELDADGNLLIHVVKGQKPLLEYNYDISHGQQIRREMRAALADKFDIDREFVLAICGLVDRFDDGSWHFRSPYYGWGNSNQVFGLCFAADCEMMDTLNYANEREKFRYREHLGKFEKTLGSFNRLYIGGLAHELGHGLSLPHNAQKPWERRSLGTALMGAGNHTWRNEKVAKKGSFLTLSSGTRLISHPLFTQSNRARFQPNIRARINELRFIDTEGEHGNELIVQGTVESSPPGFALIVDTDPEGNSNYDSHTWVGEVSESGAFSIPVRTFKPGQHEMRLSLCQLNGKVSELDKIPFKTNQKGIVNPEALNAALQWRKAELACLDGQFDRVRSIAAEVKAKLSSGEMVDRIKHLVDVVDGLPEPVSLSKVESDRCMLSRAVWDEAQVGWAEATRDRYAPGTHNRQVCLLPGGEFHARGLYAHAASKYTFSLQKKWKKFTATCGLQQGAFSTASAVFTVTGDGIELFKSKKLNGSKLAKVDIDVSGVDKLELIVKSGTGSNNGCWSVWGSPEVSR